MWENASSRFSSSLLQEEYRTGAPNGIKRCSFRRRRRRKENKSFSVKTCKDSWLQGSSHVKNYEFICVWLGGKRRVFRRCEIQQPPPDDDDDSPFLSPLFPFLSPSFLTVLIGGRIFSPHLLFSLTLRRKEKENEK